MLTAGDIDGFANVVCEVVERKHERDDTDPTRGWDKGAHG